MMSDKGGLMKQKRILVLGATGAMGQYLVPLLSRAGFRVDGVSFDVKESNDPNVRFIRADIKDRAAYREMLANRYDAIVDFLIYPTADLMYYLPLALDSTEHYIYLSSYRIYDGKEVPTRETSPRLIDSDDSVYLRNSDDYSIFKARGENILMARPRKNWTAVRPAVTYSLMRYQLVTLEAPDTVGRAFAGKTVVVPEQARCRQATMSWAGDVAQMIAKLIFNERAFGEIFTVSTAEHHTWEEIAEYYKEICGMKTLWVDKEDYIRILSPDPYVTSARWQLEFDRLFDRVMDNSKILAATGMTQSDLMPLYDGLKHEIARCPRDVKWRVNTGMDEYLCREGIN